MRHCLLLTLALATAVAATSAVAGQGTGTFRVGLRIVDTCRVDSAAIVASTPAATRSRGVECSDRTQPKARVHSERTQGGDEVKVYTLTF